ncbi:amidohydrolase [Spongiactinospora gelatinilytica]|uniref:Amidohydrolase n=1 Tax=Spongiactinospora gelatinilytica TaxID=2666298 RepID=A0A2W2GSG8_9ACTN|nr:amidohydrolase [Spongiactinospora gelatinilytica]PZG37117.1 amidohydrolase [Spongiactinospora gelatinilytica]
MTTLTIAGALLPGHGPATTTVLVKDGRIAAIGEPPTGTVLDAEGGSVLPGFIDAHAHLLSLGESMAVLDLRDAADFPEVVRRVAARAATAAPGEWIIGRGWTPAGDPPHHHPLSQAAPDNPVLLNRFDHHGAVVNAAALRLAEVDAGTADPPGGRVLRHEGEPTGVLLETAADLVRAVIPARDAAGRRRLLRQAAAHCLRLGLTGLHDAIDDVTWIDDYRALLAEGVPMPRIFGMVRAPAEGDLAEFAGDVLTGTGDPRFALQRLRLVSDGGLAARGALFAEPYCDDPGHSGAALVTQERIREAARAVLAHGHGLTVHAIGDLANHRLLNTLEPLLADRPGHRFVVEHATVVTPGDQRRMAALGLIASVQPAHLHAATGYLLDRLGADRARHAYAFRSMLRAGVRLAHGTDFPVAPPDPMLTLHAGETRQSRSGGEPLFPAERLTRAELLHGATAEGAYMARREHDLGALTPGHRADLAVLDRDLFAADPAELPQIRVRHTLIDGIPTQ